MTWTAAEFLDLLEERGIMPADHVDHLREQMGAANCEIHPVHIARKLVEARYLNPYFAKTLLEEGYRRGRGASSAKARSTSSANDDLDLAPLEEEQRAEAKAMAEGPPMDLRIELPPLSDPDAWPSASESGLALPPVKLSRPHGGRPLVTSFNPGRSAELPWLLWALGGAVAVLALIVVVLLITR